MRLYIVKNLDYELIAIFTKEEDFEEFARENGAEYIYNELVI